MFKWVLRVSALTLGLSYVSATTSCQALQQSQLASLNERMNQMINTLYSSPFLSSLSKSKSSSPPQYSQNPPPSEYPPPPQSPYEPYYPPYQQSTSPSPHVVYMSSSAPSGTPPSVSITTTTQPCPYHSAEPENYPKPYPPSYYDYYYNQNSGCQAQQPSAPSYPPQHQAPAAVTRTYEYTYPAKPYEQSCQCPDTSNQYPPAPAPPPCAQTPPACPSSGYSPAAPSYSPPPPPPTPTYSPPVYPPAQPAPAYPGYGPQAVSPYSAYPPTRTEFVSAPSQYSYSY